MTTSTEVTVELALSFRDGSSVKEDKFASVSPEDVLRLDTQEGFLLLRHGDTSCQLGDVMLNLISMICVEIPSLLEEDEQAWFEAYSSEMVVSFAPSGDMVSVIDGGAPACDYPTADLVAALRAAATRYADLLRTLWPDVSQDVLDQFGPDAV